MRDRSPKPQAAAQKLLHSWLKHSCQGDPVLLLERLDVTSNEGECWILIIDVAHSIATAILIKLHLHAVSLYTEGLTYANHRDNICKLAHTRVYFRD